jgi:hypothetical protein
MKDIGSIPPDRMEKYHSEFKRGAKLFQKALEDFHKSKIPAQKEQFRKVMDEALNVMNQTAIAVCREKSQKTQEKKLEKDYHTFVDNPSKEKYEVVHKDIEDLRKMF